MNTMFVFVINSLKFFSFSILFIFCVFVILFVFILITFFRLNLIKFKGDNI